MCLGGQYLFQKARNLSKGICSILSKASGQTESSQAIRKLFEAELEPKYLPGNFSGTAESLLQKDNPGTWHYWQERRIQRLAAKVRQHPIVFIQGEAGVGKSHIAKKVAKRLNPKQPVTSLTISPLTTIDDLFGRDVLKTIPGTTDSHTIFEPGPLWKWAKQSSDLPMVLVLDEANLARPELWGCLKGLFELDPCLYFHGKRLPVSSNHRIIMTGNPDHFSGRKTNAFLKKRIPTLYYKSLDPSFQATQVVRPKLEKYLEQVPDEEQRHSLVNGTLKATMALYKGFQDLLPGHEFTPRDLTDFNARLARYLSHFSPDQLSQPGVNRLAWQAMEDTLGGELKSAFAWRKLALKTWYENRFPCDDSLLVAHQSRFDHFYNNWLLAEQRLLEEPMTGSKPRNIKPGTRFNLSNQSVKSLLKDLWLDLERAHSEKATEQKHKGRHATLVRGPAGRGKDVLIDHLISQWNASSERPLGVKRLNAGPHNWDEIQKAIKNARDKGEILIISELNLVKTEYLEGAMNDLLTGKAEPGFHLFVTINPASYTGRHPISKALQSRFRTLNISSYTPADLEQIAHSLIRDKEQANQVTRWHCQLESILQRRNIPVLPTAGDISKLATKLNQAQPPLSGKALQKLFSKHYFIYLKCARCSVDELETTQPSGSQDDQGENLLLKGLTNRLNQEYSKQLPGPVSILKGINNHYNALEGIITLKDSSSRSETELMTDTIRLLAENAWVKKGLPITPPDHHNILFSACYKRWQQTFAAEFLPQFPKPLDLFPMTKEEEDTLKIPENQSIIATLEELFHSPPDTQQLLEFRNSLYKQVDAIKVDHDASMPVVKPMAIDGKTITQKLTRHLTEVFFKTDTRLYRNDVRTLSIKADGSISIESEAWGKMGFESIYPAPLGKTVILSENQDYGTIIAKPSTTWKYIPSLWAHTILLSARTSPEMTIEWRRDIYTGRFMYRFTRVSSFKIQD